MTNPSMRKSLLRQWMGCLPRAPFDQAVHAYFRLEDHYSEDNREYHGLRHIEIMLSASAHYFPEASYELTLAIFGHDAIHTGTSPEDERRSSVYMATLLAELEVRRLVINTVGEAILTTATHQAYDLLGQQLDDLDLLSLGSPPHIYRQNTAKIRAEYQIPDEHWRAGRLAFIQRFLERPSIYQTTELREQFEVQARTNLRAERDALLAV